MPVLAAEISRFVWVVVEVARSREASAAAMGPESENVAVEGSPSTGRMEIALPDELLTATQHSPLFGRMRNLQ